MQVEQPFELVFFGGLGDLALRKLFPSLYLLELDERLPEGKILAVGRSEIDHEIFIEKIQTAIFSQVKKSYQSGQVWKRFSQRLNYVCVDAQHTEDYKNLSEVLSTECPNRLFYFATASFLYADIAKNLDQNQLINSATKVVLEKPIGQDFESAHTINNEVAKYFNEDQIYRIDHYLGKETVQNLMVLRFANPIFESQWNQKHIDHIQISISESLGVEQRAGFYEQVGAFRDMVQNHLLQLLCIVAMEPPSKMEADAVRDEKVKVLKALKPIEGKYIYENVIRGQYAKGVSEGVQVPSYRDEEGVDNKSDTETFVAMKVEIENWRWAGVPFYLRTGKRLAERACEIVVQFKSIPHSIFSMQNKDAMANKLVFRLQPNEDIRLQLCEKKVGSGMDVRPVVLSLNPDNLNKKNAHKLNTTEDENDRAPEAYERLLFDALAGNPTLFLRDDELMEAWKWVDPILSEWKKTEGTPVSYTSGSWGPGAATILMAKDGRLWNENN